MMLTSSYHDANIHYIHSVLWQSGSFPTSTRIMIPSLFGECNGRRYTSRTSVWIEKGHQ